MNLLICCFTLDNISASKSDREEVRNLADRTCAVIFLSTPHMGSPLASLSDTSRFLLQTPRYVHELRMSMYLHNKHSIFTINFAIDYQYNVSSSYQMVLRLR